MSEYDLVIAGGTIATASDTFKADIGIRDHRIVQIGEHLATDGKVIDASDRLVLPGGIDSHVHISQPAGDGIIMADDFESATRSALFGGNTMVMPFCPQVKGTPLRQTINAYHKLTEGKCYTDVGFHLILSEVNDAILGQEMPALVADGYTSLKVFMTYPGMRLTDGEILATLAMARRTGATVMVHCENDDAVSFLIEKHEQAGEIAPRFHPIARPIAAEREATHRATTLAEVAETRIVIVHVSNGQAMDEISRARARGVHVVGETCPQYLLLTAADLDDMDFEGAKLVCSPPPRDRASQVDCWRGLETGVFDLFSSDHCPYRYDDEHGKLNPLGRKSFRYIPNGIPGVETRMPILFSEGVVKGRISLNQFVALTSTNHAKTYGLYPRKGTIAIGADADIAIWDPKHAWTIRHADLHDGADYTPYEGISGRGSPRTVLLGGKVMIEEGHLLGRKGDGGYVPSTVPGANAF